MRTAVKLKRASFFVNETTLRRAQKALGVKSRAEVVRLSIERVIEMEELLAIHGEEPPYGQAWQF